MDEQSRPAHFFRVGPGYINNWIHETTHWEFTQRQQRCIDDLSTEFHRLLQARNEVQAARGLFGPVSIYYPDNTPTSQQQQRLFSATKSYLNAFYSTLNSLSSLVTRFRHIFGQAPTNSAAKFIRWLHKNHGLFMDDFEPHLEHARAFRAMITHKESYPPFEWGTADIEGLTMAALIGDRTHSGGLPEIAAPFEQNRWSAVAPDEDIVCTALAVQLNALLPLLGKGQDPTGVYSCSYLPEFSEDDARTDYPIFAVGNGEVAETFTREVETTVRVRTSSGESQTFHHGPSRNP